VGELPLYKNIMLIGSGIEICIEKKLIGPALILIYSGIDTMGWLNSTEKNATRNSFMNWVDTYLLKAKPLPCTSLDLYAARCGLLHSFTPDSQLSSSGRARYINYAWGTAIVQDLQRTIDVANKSDECVAIHIKDLYEAWRLGVLKFTEELENDPEKKAKVYQKAGRFFDELSLETMSNVLTVINKNWT
jgi:hypothetical protein